MKLVLGWICESKLIKCVSWLENTNLNTHFILGGTNMNKKLNAKDFILIGVLTALMWIICMIISTVMSIAGPVTNVFYPAVTAVPNGIVMMLLLAKVSKRGTFTICGTIQGILFLLVGGFWLIPVALIIGGVICDFLIMGRSEVTMRSMMIAYTIFSGVFAFGAIVGPMSFLRNAFVGAMEKNNIAQEYIDGMIQITSGFMPAVIVVAGLLGGLLGGYIGQKTLKKHFIKAGLVSAK